MSVTNQVLTSTNIVPYHQITIEIIRQQITFTVRMTAWWVKFGVACCSCVPIPNSRIQSVGMNRRLTSVFLRAFLRSRYVVAFSCPWHSSWRWQLRCLLKHWKDFSIYCTPNLEANLTHKTFIAETHRQDLWGSLLIACCTCISNCLGYCSKPETSWPVAIS